MLIGGLQKTTLIDYPGKVACTVFTVGCNFRCPFCHNRDLVTLKLFKQAGLKALREKEFFAFLKKRKGILDGVCITGGEPTIQPDLPDFIRKIRNLGYLVKLDTNGGNPEMLKALIKQKLLDYIAMDIKGPLDEAYLKIIGLTLDKKIATLRSLKNTEITENFQFLSDNSVLQCCKKSIRTILKSGIPFEFRTTIVSRLHNKNNMVKLARQLKKIAISYKQPFDFAQGKSAISYLWLLQPFRPQNCLDPKFLKIKPFNNAELKEILRAVQTIIPQAKMRGN